MSFLKNISNNKSQKEDVLSVWYKEYYEDANNSELSAEEHYQKIGCKKGYFPNPKKLLQNVWKKTSFPLRSCLNFYASQLNFPKSKKPDYISAVLIVKNEAPYLKEWLDYHLLVGISKFYIFDNESSDNLQEILAPYINKKIVVLEKIKGSLQQNYVYNLTLSRHRYDTIWLAIIDADEFIIPVYEKDLPSTLKKYEKYSGLGINWVMYDGCGHQTKPEGLVMENYTTVHKHPHPKNLHIKSIVNPRKVKLCGSPHYCDMKKGQTVDENRNPIQGAFTKEHHSSIIRINHYFCKSMEEYQNKIMRGRATSPGKYKIKKDEFAFNDAVTDKIALPFVQKLKNSNIDNLIK